MAIWLGPRPAVPDVGGRLPLRRLEGAELTWKQWLKVRRDHTVTPHQLEQMRAIDPGAARYIEDRRRRDIPPLGLSGAWDDWEIE